jgi:hypothetical protein
MANDAHNVDPITDLNQKITVSDPSIVLTDNPKAPPLPILTPIGGLFNAPNVAATIESVFERVKINGVSPTFKGNFIDFDLPRPPTVTTPIISSISNFQSQLPPPAPVLVPAPATPATPTVPAPETTASRLDDPITPKLDASFVSRLDGPITPKLDAVSALKIYGDQMDTTPSTDVSRQKGGSSKLDELNNMNLVDSSANIFTPREDYSLPEMDTSSLVPLFLTRGDGKKECLIYVRAEASFVVGDNTSGDDHTSEKPESSSYYTAPRDGKKNGDMLYWDEEKKSWVLLEAPPASSSIYVLTHDGTVPSWSETEECEETYSSSSS